MTTPKPGQIWQEVDPRFERFIRVELLTEDEIFIQTVQKVDGEWKVKPRSKATRAVEERFNGKRGGYRYVE